MEEDEGGDEEGRETLPSSWHIRKERIFDERPFNGRKEARGHQSERVRE